MTYVREERKPESTELKNLTGEDIEAVTTAKRGGNRDKIIAQSEEVGLSE